MLHCQCLLYHFYERRYTIIRHRRELLLGLTRILMGASFRSSSITLSWQSVSELARTKYNASGVYCSGMRSSKMKDIFLVSNGTLWFTSIIRPPYELSYCLEAIEEKAIIAKCKSKQHFHS